MTEMENNHNDSKDRILMVHNFYQIGGGEHTVFKNEVELLRSKGHTVIEYTRSNDELKKSKLKMVLAPFSTLWSFKTYFDIKKLVNEESINIVHCHNTFPLISPSVYYAANKQKVPVVQTIHNFRFLCPGGTFFRDGHVCELCLENGSFSKAIKYRCYRNSRIQTIIVAMMLKLHRLLGTYKKINYVFLTDFNRQKFNSLIDVNAKNVFVKPNFTQRSYVYKKKDKNKTGPNKTFVFAGRLDESKGILFLLNIWKKMPEEYSLIIMGDGPYKVEVEKAVSEYSNIHYLGFQSHDSLLEILEQSTGLIFPSIWYEGFPMIIAESFSIGCPVVSSGIGNQAVIVKSSGGGVLFDPTDDNSFIDAINELVSTYNEASANAIRYYENNMTPDANYRCMIDIYNKVKQNG